MATETSAAELPYDGKPLTLGRVTYTLPELPLRHVKVLARLAAQIPAVAGAADAEALAQFEALAEPFAELLHVSLRRNYPSLSRDVVDDGLTLPVFLVALPLVLEVNGFAKPEGGSGNGAAPQPASTGAPSTPG